MYDKNKYLVEKSIKHLYFSLLVANSYTLGVIWSDKPFKVYFISLSFLKIVSGKQLRDGKCDLENCRGSSV